MNHNSLYFIVMSSLLIKVYGQCMISYRIDQTLMLIDSTMINSCISQRSLIEYYDYGIYAIELDKELVKSKVNNTINSNLSFTDNKIQYYFYDCFTMQSCLIGNNKCNSVQIKISINFNDDEAIKYYRFEIMEIL